VNGDVRKIYDDLHERGPVLCSARSRSFACLANPKARLRRVALTRDLHKQGCPVLQVSRQGALLNGCQRILHKFPGGLIGTSTNDGLNPSVLFRREMNRQCCRLQGRENRQVTKDLYWQKRGQRVGVGTQWWALSDLNGRPFGCKPNALTAELSALTQVIVQEAASSVNAVGAGLFSAIGCETMLRRTAQDLFPLSSHQT
jgi:hypothetical protein